MSGQSVRQVIEGCKFGKILPGDFYIHISCIPLLPDVLHDMLKRARHIAEGFEFNLVKFSKQGTHVTLLEYLDFDSDPHPGLATSVRVDLITGTYKFRTYDPDNPPILHRKETFVRPCYPRFSEFREITRREEEAGLLNRRDIGYRKPWNTLVHGIAPHLV